MLFSHKGKRKVAVRVAMEHFCTGRISGSYLEFQRGEYTHPWRDDSIYIYDETCAYTGLDRIFRDAIPDYDTYGLTRVTAEDWEKVEKLAAERGGPAAEAVEETHWWTSKTLAEYGFFTICGI